MENVLNVNVCAQNLRHVKVHKKEIIKWDCEGCGKSYKQQDHFQRHVEKCCNQPRSFIAE